MTAPSTGPMGLHAAAGGRLTGSSSDGSALLRAAGARERDPAVRCPDTLARAFIADMRIARLGDTRAGHWLARTIAESRNPGAYWYEIGRVKHFDGLLLGEIHGGVEQVVILGAGLDSRAYRFAAQLNGRRVVEVDHPVTAARKRDRVQATFGRLPEHVRFVVADLSTDQLGDQLSEAGLDRKQTVFVLCSGLTMYLAEESWRAVTSWLAGFAPGTSIAFDYDFAAFVAGDDRFHGAPELRRFTARIGEPHRLGFDPDALPATMEQWGLAVVTNVRPDELANRYLRRSTGQLAGRPYGFMALAHAQVPRHD